jgi:ABC-2 type transport system ATP-binding protein
MWDRVAELRSTGTTVVITTHDMEEAATLSDRVAIIDYGKLLALDTPTALVRDMAGERTLDCLVEPVTATDAGDVQRALAGLSETDRIEMLDDREQGGWRFRIYVQSDPASLVALVARHIEASGARLVDVRLGEPTLEDVFIHLTGRSLR